MNRFRDQIKVIPGLAWIIAFAVFTCMFLLLFGIAIPRDNNLSGWPLWASVLFSGTMAMILFAYVLLVGYVNGDAQRRGMRRALWTVIAIFVPNAIGIILYFFMREPLLDPCPQCHVLVRSTFAFCPNCAAQLRTACPNCRRPAEPGWKTCAYCGAGLNLAPGAPAR